MQLAGASGESDDALMARVIARDRAAFRLLADRHGARIYRIAWRMTGNATEAEDVAQDALLKLWSQTGWTAGQGGVGAWLARVATNACLDRLRKTRFASDEDVPERADDAPLADDRLGGQDEARLARDAIAALPDAQRAAIVLTYYEDLPQQGCGRNARAQHQGVRIIALSRTDSLEGGACRIARGGGMTQPFSDPEMRMLDRFAPPPLPAGFADRVLTKLPTETVSPPRRRDPRGGWRRGRVALIAGVGSALLSVGAAAAGLLGVTVQNMPVITSIADAGRCAARGPRGGKACQGCARQAEDQTRGSRQR